MSGLRFAQLSRPTPGSAAIAAAIAAVCVGLTLLAHDRLSDHPGDADAVWLVLTLAACVPLAFPSRVPLVAAVVTLSLALLGVLLDRPMTAAIVLALVLVGRTTSRAPVRLTPTLGVYSGGVVATAAVATGDAAPLVGVVAGVAVGLLPAVLGENLRVERVRTRDAQELARRVEELRDGDVQRAVAEERLRIARDLHDITGHHLSAIALQSAGAGRTTSDPVAVAAFARIHAQTAQALGQTSRTLGALRDASEPAALAPSPRLAHVEQLLEPARAAGIAVALRVEGEPRELPETTELCAYRVVQESLTNVVRHARARSVEVVVDYGPTALTIAVRDDGSGNGDGDGSRRAGAGIQGMRERVGLAGGSLAAGPRDDGEAGWAVHATLPVEGLR
jgi:signal transduction histidine kinase